jgi:hypothetical protein
MSTPLAAVGAVAEAVADVSKEVTQRDAEENAADVKLAAMAAQIQELREMFTQHVNDKNLHAVQQDVSP